MPDIAIGPVKRVVTACASFSGYAKVSIELTPALLQEIRLVYNPKDEGELLRIAAMKAFVRMLGDVNTKVVMDSVQLSNLVEAQHKDYQ